MKYQDHRQYRLWHTLKTMPVEYDLVKVGRRWAVVANHGNGGGIGRHGYWADDSAGGYGVHPWSAEKAIDQCSDPVTYATKREALEVIDEAEAYAL